MMCKNCKFWKEKEYFSFKFCGNVDYLDNNKSATIVSFVSNDTEISGIYLKTEENFGCVNFQPKE